MDFMGIGLWEFLFILLITLMVVGPKRLPEVARTMGRFVRKFRRITAELTREFTSEIENEVKELKSGINEASQEISSDVKDVSASVTTEVNKPLESSPTGNEPGEDKKVNPPAEKKYKIEKFDG